MSQDGYRRTMTMDLDALGDDDDDDHFFESYDRISSAIALDLASSGSDDDHEDFDDSRMSFASAVSSASYFSRIATSTTISRDYDIWLAEPGSITERRNRLLHGMGLTDKDLVDEIKRVVSKKVGSCKVSSLVVETPSPSPSNEETEGEEKTQQVNTPPVILVRSRSDGDIDFQSVARRKEEFFGGVSKQRLIRTLSNNAGPCVPACRHPDAIRVSPKGENVSSFRRRRHMSTQISNTRFGAFFLIKNLDTGKEFIVNEYNNQGMWNRFSDLQTGKQLTMEEFEKCVGFSPVVKELMRRENVTRMSENNDRKLNAFSKSLRMSKRSGAALLKNIKGVANSMSGLIGDKERENQQTQEQKYSKNSSEWIKVRQHGKSYKELTALRLCQEIQAHEGSIWTMKFSLDAHYLASAGEDRIIHIWEVQDHEVMPLRQPDDWSWSPLQSPANSTPDRQFPTEVTSSPAQTPPLVPVEKKKKGKGSQNTKKGIPDYVHVPETVFALSEKPICSFKGHLDDILDLSWSRSQLLLSSSMDKTVRLWDLETKSCLKLFAHNDYVTCIQFNPMDDDYFISGSLDAKVRIWNIPDRQVVDWIDFHEMITAICYTPDGQGAIVGSHKGTCRMYSTEDCKLEQISQLDIQNKKKSARKITGLQFAPWNPSELLITSADSRVRIMDGLNMAQKFRGFRNTSSQIAASYSPDGKHVISASEDSQVYVWKRSMPRHGSNGKGKGPVNTGSYEHFQCRDVSVAIPWPGTVKGDPPLVPIHSKRQSKRVTQPPASGNISPTQEEGLLGASRRQLPPLPKKKDTTVETTSIPTEEELARFSRLDSGVGMGDSFNSATGSMRCGDSPSISTASNNPSSASSSPWSLFDGGNSNGNGIVQATAWGMVIVTAGLGGAIRAYQNIGLPRRVGRQPALFRDYT